MGIIINTPRFSRLFWPRPKSAALLLCATPQEKQKTKDKGKQRIPVSFSCFFLMSCFEQRTRRVATSKKIRLEQERSKYRENEDENRDRTVNGGSSKQEP